MPAKASNESFAPLDRAREKAALIEELDGFELSERGLREVTRMGT